MAGRQRSTFQKRQKEVKRLETQRMKAEKRAARAQERALQRAAGIAGTDEFSGAPTPLSDEVTEVGSRG